MVQKKKTTKTKAAKPAPEVVENGPDAVAPDTEKAPEKVEDEVEEEEEEAAPEESKPVSNGADSGAPAKEESKPTEEDSKPPAADKTPSKKRKQATGPEEPRKLARRSGRGASKSQPSQEQLLKYLLSRDAEDLCRPEDEKEDIRSRGDIKTYSSSVLTPFEELLCAVILSRPISHRLGLRTIRTVLNDPYNFTNAKAIKDAGEEKQLQALWDAKTQHKDKTASQIGMIADITLEKFTSSDDKSGTQLGKALKDSNGDIDAVLASLKENIKGLGNTGLDIFLRRVQWLWEAGFPFVDGRTRLAMKELGLPDDAEELRKALESRWKMLDTKRVAGDGEAAKKRRAFVTVLERVTGASLEGKTEALLEAAAAL